MDQTIGRVYGEQEEPQLFDVIRPFVRYYWLLLGMALIVTLAFVIFSYATPANYRSESLLMVNSDYSSPQFFVDLIEARGGVTVEPLSGGLVKLSAEAGSPEIATNRLNTAIDDATAILAGSLPDYQSQIAVAQEQYQQLASAMANAETVEGILYLAGPSAEILRKIQSLELKEMNKSSLLSVLERPTTPVTSEPRITANQVLLAAMAGLVLGAVVAYFLFYKEAILHAASGPRAS